MGVEIDKGYGSRRRLIEKWRTFPQSPAATLELIVPDICAYKFDKEVITEGSRKRISVSIELKEA